jgi:hypothetical protein
MHTLYGMNMRLTCAEFIAICVSVGLSAYDVVPWQTAALATLAVVLRLLFRITRDWEKGLLQAHEDYWRRFRDLDSRIDQLGERVKGLEHRPGLFWQPATEPNAQDMEWTPVQRADAGPTSPRPAVQTRARARAALRNAQ